MKNTLWLIVAALFVVWLFTALLQSVKLQSRYLDLKERELLVKEAEAKQFDYEFGSITIAGTAIPILLEKKSGLTYQFLLGGDKSGWKQMSYFN